MRMWMVPPKRMCCKHLIAEHCELHVAVGTIEHGKNLYGFYDKRILFPGDIVRRHGELVQEMEHRNYRHSTPIRLVTGNTATGEDLENNTAELARRCSECRKLLQEN